MMPFPKIHDLYIGRVVLGSVLLTWAVLIGLDATISGMLNEMSDVGTGNYDFLAALTNVAYSLVVEDLLRQQRATYDNLLGQLATTVADIEALATCP